MDTVDSEDIFDLVIVGAGPHGLAVAARIREPRPSALYTDAESSRLSFLRKYAARGREGKPKSLAALKILVIDKAGNQWISQWHKQFDALEIKHLRSPMFFHPDPSDLDALLAYSHGKGCHCDDVEISGVVGKERSKHKRKQTRAGKCRALATDFNERDRQDYFNPSAQTFREFCLRIVDRYALHNLIRQAEVESIDYCRIHEKHVGPLNEHFAISLTGSQKRVYSKALVLAPGVGGHPNIPPHLNKSSRLQSWCHSSDLATMTFPPASLKHKRGTTSLLIIGGGLTSAQIVDLALGRGVDKVYLIMRSHMKIKHFDLDLSWLGKVGNIMKMQFYQSDFAERAKTVLQARNGGSITPTYAKLLSAHEKTGNLSILTKTTIRRAEWNAQDLKWSINLERESSPGASADPSQVDDVDYIVCATGTRPDFQKLPFLKPILSRYPTEASCGLPHLTEDLQINPTLPLFVASGYAALQLGPGAFNLSGSREGAERIVNRLEELDRDEKAEVDLGMLAGNEANYYEILSAA